MAAHSDDNSVCTRFLPFDVSFPPVVNRLPFEFVIFGRCDVNVLVVLMNERQSNRPTQGIPTLTQSRSCIKSEVVPLHVIVAPLPCGYRFFLGLSVFLGL